MKNFDNSFLSKNIKYVCGIDEAGRGPLAGPVVAAAVIFENNVIIDGINDSKKLTEKKRELLFNEIKEKALAYGIGIISENEIDEINILQAALKAMKNAYLDLATNPDLILIDGNKSFQCDIPNKTIIKGDSKSFSIAAASILAKVTRDRIMINASKNYPQFYWEKNKGYGTKQHIEAIKKHGITKIHRKSFLKKYI
ncbi:MAG: ribonuclease HII [Ignavibacteria bacterium]|jgi:ribonuclease HII